LTFGVPRRPFVIEERYPELRSRRSVYAYLLQDLINRGFVNRRGHDPTREAMALVR